MVEALPGKVLLHPVIPPKEESDGGIALLSDTAKRSFAGVGTEHMTGDRYLYNQWAACEMDDGLVVSRKSDLIAISPWASSGCDFFPINGYVKLRALPLAAPATKAGILLTERYRGQVNGGVEPWTRQLIQCGLARVEAVAYDAEVEYEQGDWLLFGYYKAHYYVLGGIEYIFVRGGHPQVALCVMSKDFVLQTFGENCFGDKS
jgi:co-chaperonin GroES (HSP10)